MLAYDRRLEGNRKRSLGFPVRDANGKLIPENVAQAKREVVELSNRLIRGESPRGRVTLGELFNLFRREVVARQSRKQRAETLRELDLWTNFLGAGFVVSRLGAREWNRFITERSAGEIDGRGRRVADPRPVRARTVAKSLKALRHACRFGTNYRTANGGFLLDADPTRGLPVPQEPNPARPLADYERFKRLLAVADQMQMRVAGGKHVRSYLRELLILAEETGRRIGAIVALRFSDWNPNAKPYGALGWRADSDKLGKEWSAPVTPEVRDAIEHIRRERPGLGDAWLFPALKNPSRHLDTSRAYRWLEKAEKLAGLPHPRGGGWHMFRRMWATARKDMSLKDVAAAGGWKNTATLQLCYQHPDPETLVDVVLGGRKFRLAQ